MYEPIRTKSVHSTMAADSAPHPAPLPRGGAGHPARRPPLRAARRHRRTRAHRGRGRASRAQVARLRGGLPPVRHAGLSRADAEALHTRAHALAGRALVVAASRADTAAAILAAERMDAHAAARALTAAS